MKSASLCSALALIACVCVFTGCKGNRLDGLVPAQGVLTLNGEPVDGATILFSPKTYGPDSASAQTVTGKDGKFAMTTLDPGDGVYPGEYNVSIFKDEIQGGLTLEEAKARMEDPDKYRNEKEPEQTVIHYIPTQYADFNKSGLTITIPEGGKKDVEFNLEGEVDLTPQKMTGHGGGR